MKPTKVGRNWARFSDGTGWPLPCPDDDSDTISHTLRYGTLTKIETVRYEAASMIEAYAHLIDMPQRERNARIKAIREAMALRDAGAKGGEHG